MKNFFDDFPKKIKTRVQIRKWLAAHAIIEAGGVEAIANRFIESDRPKVLECGKRIMKEYDEMMSKIKN